MKQKNQLKHIIINDLKRICLWKIGRYTNPYGTLRFNQQRVCFWDIEIFTDDGLLLLPPLELLFEEPPPSPPHATKNSKNITVAISPILFKHLMVFLLLT